MKFRRHVPEHLGHLSRITPEADPLQADVARRILDLVRGVAVQNTTPTVVPIGAWPALQRFVASHRVESALGLAAHKGLVVLPQQALDEAGQRLEDRAIYRMALEQVAAQCISTLNDADIEVRLLKGLATGHLDHVDPSVRDTVDVDILVEPCNFRRAEQVLVGAGCTIKPQKLDPEIFIESTLLHPSGIEIDLHHRVHRFGWDHHELAFAGSEEVPGVGAAMQGAQRFDHAVAHLLYSPFGHRRLSSLIDVAVIEQAGEPRWVSNETAAMASHSAGLLETATRPRNLLDWAHLGHRRRLGGEILCTLAAAPSWRHRGRNIVGQLRSFAFSAA